MNARIAYISLGSNVGDSAATLIAALEAVNEMQGLRVRRVSQFHQTEPVLRSSTEPQTVGPADQPKYWNAVAEIETSLEPHNLLKALQGIEERFGRDRSREQRWGPRTCDIDILLIGDMVVSDAALTIPHARLHERLFVLRPLASLAPDAVHPLLRRTVVELLAEVEVSK
jgi:2-amino-4-hydroxy-6-hydroxymethyldihydropteridine diphosphokinase